MTNDSSKMVRARSKKASEANLEPKLYSGKLFINPPPKKKTKTKYTEIDNFRAYRGKVPLIVAVGNFNDLINVIIEDF